jgi:hypothetical protein
LAQPDPEDVAAGATLGLGIGVSITTDIPLAPKAGLLIGADVGTRRSRTERRDAVAEKSSRSRGSVLYLTMWLNQLSDVGALLEWSPVNLLAVDAADDSSGKLVADLAEREGAGHGRTQWKSDGCRFKRSRA